MEFILFILFILFIIFIIFIIIQFWSLIDTDEGESVVNSLAKSKLDTDQYHLLKNVTLPTQDGSTQIDQIIVSIYGIFVIETKNMTGWIFGNPDQPTWTQKIYQRSYRFQNPLRQNYKHIRVLESLLRLNKGQIHSVIVFVGESTFKTKMPDNVKYRGEYIRYIKSKTRPVMTKSKVNEIISKIETSRLAPSFTTNRQHIKHVRNIIAKKKKSRY